MPGVAHGNTPEMADAGKRAARGGQAPVGAPPTQCVNPAGGEDHSRRPDRISFDLI